MTLPHNDATAALSINGIALCCFNRRKPRWEVAFLRHPAHELLLTVTPPPEGVATPIKIPEGARQIRIKTKRGKRPDYPHSHPGGFFDPGAIDRKELPTDPDLRESFRWAIDLNGAEVHHGKLRRLKKPPYPVTMVHVSDALFYTCSQAENKFYLLPEGVDPNDLGDEELARWELGYASELLAADIRCAEGGRVRIEIDGMDAINLEHRQHATWRIGLTNLCPTSVRALSPDWRQRGDDGAPPGSDARPLLVEGDFRLYYYFVEVEGAHDSLWGPLRFVRSNRTDCNAEMITGVDNLDPLL